MTVTSGQVPLHIAVFAPNWVGDQVMAYEFFCGLRKINPHAQIHVFCRPWVVAIQFKQEIDTLTVLGVDPWYRQVQKVLQFRRQHPCKIGYCLNRSVLSQLYLFLLGVKKAFFFTESKKQVMHRSDMYLRLLHPLFPLHSGKAGLVYKKPFSAQKQWRTGGHVDYGFDMRCEYFVMAPCAQAASRQWDLGRFLRLGKMLHRFTGWKAILVGSQQDKEHMQDLEPHPAFHNIAGTTTVAGLALLFEKAKVVIANESGLAHVAALCKAPVHIVCGAANPLRTKPVAQFEGQVCVATSAVSCWPCEKNTCKRKDQPNACLKEISEQSVFDAVCRQLRLQ
jgi:ADP-heptose:LPS heptosyltransferase